MDKYEFAEQVAEAEAMLYHISKSILKNDFDCADAVQEAILKAFSKLSMLKADKYFKTWICRILINECYRIYRSNKRIVSFEEYVDTEQSSAQMENGELFASIMKMGEKLRIVIVLHYIEGFHVNEIAEILKTPEGTVKSRLSRARSELKSIMKEQEECHNEMG